jgi:L-lactate dehydrogenase complex protein LldE
MKVSLFVPCLVEEVKPEIGAAAARVLARAGCEVEYPPGQTCCGQPLYKAGHADKVRGPAKHFLRVFEQAEAVVAPSGSCVAMVRKAYPLLLEDEPHESARARDLAERTFEFSEFLAGRLGVLDLGAELHALAVYHDSCQVGRALGVREEPLKLMAHVKGLRMVQLQRPEACCGFGGTFSLQFPELSTAITEDKLADIEGSGADVAITAEPSCLINIESMMRHKKSQLRIMHLAELLDTREPAE